VSPRRIAVTTGAMRSWSVLFAFVLCPAVVLVPQGHGGEPGGAPAAVSSPKPGVPRVREVPGLHYVTGESAHPTKHQLDLFLPAKPLTPDEANTKPPLVMFVHGGAWRMGDRRPYGPLGRAFAERGIACAAISYRLSPEVVHPVHVEDCARALRWLADHAAEYGYDRERLFLCGHSAGAHLVALLATDPSYLVAQGLSTKDVRGVVPISGPFDVSPGVEVFATAFGTDVEVRRDASPLRNVTKDAPPFLVLWADRDMAGLPASGKLFAAALGRADVPVESAEIADRTHGSIIARFGKADDRTTELVFGFVERLSQRSEVPAAPVEVPAGGDRGR